MKRKAFTLIELLVVIAILSLLVSILLPSLRKAKDLARRAVCGANLRTLNQVLYLYGMDNDGRLPIMPHNSGAEDPFSTSVIFVAGSTYNLVKPGDWRMADFVARYGGVKAWNCPVIDAPPIDDSRNTRPNACYGPLSYLPGNTSPVFHRAKNTWQPDRLEKAASGMVMMQDLTCLSATGFYKFNHGQGPRTQPRKDINPSMVYYLSNLRANVQGANVMRYDGSVSHLGLSSLVVAGQDGPQTDPLLLSAYQP